MTAYLQEVNGTDPETALGNAVAGYRRLHWGSSPEWVALGKGVRMPEGAARQYGLRRVEYSCRAGCVRVGAGDEEQET